MLHENLRSVLEAWDTSCGDVATDLQILGPVVENTQMSKKLHFSPQTVPVFVVTGAFSLSAKSCDSTSRSLSEKDWKPTHLKKDPFFKLEEEEQCGSCVSTGVGMLSQPSANALGGPELLTLVTVMVPSPAPGDSPHELAFLSSRGKALSLTGRGSTGQVPAGMAAGGMNNSE